MVKISRFRQQARGWTFLAVQGLLRRFSPTIAGTRTEAMFRWLGFFESPKPAEIVANYLRGYLLFGRNTPYGDWFHWFTLPARAVITRETARAPKAQQRLLQRGDLEIRYDQDVERIIRLCQNGRDGWLTESAVRVYLEMQRLGLIASVGTYRNGQLIGGFWGLSLGRVFGMMSTFHLEPNGGSVALAAISDVVSRGDRWSIVDCGGAGEHWNRFGARTLSIPQFSALVTSQLFASSDLLDYSEWIRPEPGCEKKSSSCAVSSLVSTEEAR